ncbi:MAG: hypothetical protein J8272_00790 ['Prunus persica' phytoplasma PP2]|nr:hypothetical protein ['Prunus persica' phytoplasma PP2]
MHLFSSSSHQPSSLSLSLSLSLSPFCKCFQLPHYSTSIHIILFLFSTFK